MIFRRLLHTGPYLTNPNTLARDCGRRREPAFVDVAKPGIAEADFDDPNVRAALAGGALAAPHGARGAVAAACAAALPAPLREALAPLAEPRAVALKAQRNNGARAGCFPVHYDNAGPPSKRVLTCLLYCNEGWQPVHGGELRIIAPLGARPRDVPPAPLGRVVLFASDRTLHGTLPARGGAPRRVVMLWCDGRGANARAADCALTRATLAAWRAAPCVPPRDGADGGSDRVDGARALGALAHAPIARALSRPVLTELYERTLRASLARVPDGDERAARARALAIAAHREHVRAALAGSAELRERRRRTARRAQLAWGG